VETFLIFWQKSGNVFSFFDKKYTFSHFFTKKCSFLDEKVYNFVVFE
jgi:hypothetical protein